MSNGNCVVGGRPHAAADGILLCEHHYQRLSAMLRDIEQEAVLLSAVPSMQIRTGSGKGSLASERAPVRLDVLAFRDPQTRRWVRDETPDYQPPAPKSFGPWCLFCDHESCTDWRAGRRRDLHDDEQDAGSDRLMSVLGVLNGWARVVREERTLTEPQQVTVIGERDTLSRQLVWICGQPWVDEFYAELHELRAALKRLNGTEDERPVGRCYLPSIDGMCGGPIWVDSAAGHAHCGRCRETWDGVQLAILSYELERAKRPKDDRGEPMWSATEIATEHGVKVGTIAVWAHRRRIVSVHGYYDPRAFREKATG